MRNGSPCPGNEIDFCMNTWNIFNRADSRRGRRSNTLNIDPSKSFPGKISSKRVEVRNDPFLAELHSAIKENCNSASDISIHSYGIGALFESPVSQYQYAVMLELKARLNTVQTGCYDPVLKEEEMNAILLDGVTQIAFPLSKNDIIESTHVCFMPHCEAQTYAELLRDVDEETEIANFIVYGNDLRSYRCDSMIQALEKWNFSVVPIYHELQARKDVFNDCRLQILTRK